MKSLFIVVSLLSTIAFAEEGDVNILPMPTPTATKSDVKNWLLETHFLIGQDNVGYKVLGGSFSRRLFNIFSAYGELDLMPDEDIFSKQRLNVELGFKARVETAMGLYLSAGTGLAILSSKGEGLATNWQIANTLEAGLCNNLGSIGFLYKHFSNGTSDYHNTGRDYVGFQIGHAF